MKIKLQTSAVIEALETTLSNLFAKYDALTKQQEVSSKTSDKFKKSISKHISGFDLHKTEYRGYNNTCALYFEKQMTKEEYDSLVGAESDELKYELRTCKREIEDVQKSIRLLNMSADKTVPASLLQDINRYL
jgi:hypothetical protein